MCSDDVSVVAALSEEGFGDSYRFDWQANAKALHEAAAGGRAFAAVAETGGRVCGYCNLRSWPAGGWVDQIVVSKSGRRRGVGRALLDAVVVEAAKRGYWKVSLITSAGDPEARAFFEACGWEVVGQMKDEIKTGVNGILMSRVVDYGLHPNQ
jgi:ribosomal-protein-alanine N-acetyltransferase